MRTKEQGVVTLWQHLGNKLTPSHVTTHDITPALFPLETLNYLLMFCFVQCRAADVSNTTITQTDNNTVQSKQYIFEYYFTLQQP